MFKFKLIRNKLIGLTLTMFVAVISVSGAGGYILYQTAITEAAHRLTETAKSNARLIEAVAKYDINHSKEMHSGVSSYESTFSQIKEAQEQFRFGRSGEFTLAKREGNQIVFVIRNYLAGMDIPDPVSFDRQDRAEPMRKALSGRSGWMMGNDYRGKYVMAAYEPVSILNLGLVAKIDVKEIREPFIRAGLIIVSLAVLVSIVALFIFYRTSIQISKKFEDSTEQFNRLANNAKDLIYRMSIPDGRYEYVNAAAMELCEVSPEEFYTKPIIIRQLIHPAWRTYFEDQWNKLLVGDVPLTYEYQILTRSGKTKWISQRNVLITDDSGSPIAIEAIATDITDLKNIENAVRKSKEKFQALFDQAGSYSMILDPNTADGIPVIIEANEAACSAHGYTREEFVGRPVADLDDEDGKQLVKSRTAEIMTGNPFYFENMHIRKDGSKFYVATNAKRIDIANDPPLILSTQYDITERKRAEQSLVESERLSRATFDQAAVGIGRNSTDGKWLDVNQKLCDIVGYSRDELLTKTFQDITYKDDLGSGLKMIQEILDGKRANYTMDKRYIKRGGDLLWVRLTVSLVRGDDGAPLYFISVIEDINKRKKAEDSLREAAAVFRSTAEGVTITDKNGTILDVNEAFTKITGYSREEAIGQNPRLLQSGRQDKQFFCDMWDQLIKHGHWHGEIWNRAKNGAEYPEILTINSIKSKDEEVTGYVGVFADISALKATENRLDYMAHHDSLTDLPNRLLFRDRLIHSLAGAKRRKGKIAVVFLDLDHFKNINDTLGHGVGDQLLVEIARRLKIHVREEDTVGRISGDEFCLLFEGIQYAKDTTPMIEKLYLVFEESFVVNDHVLRMSASMGVAIYPDNSHDPDELLSFADAAMYEAKDVGRNTCRFYSRELTEQAIEYRFVQSCLKDAMEQSQLFLVYQPQIDLITKSMVGLEVLIRWQHPEKGLIPPNKFIPIAEQSGFIRDLGPWILKTACAQGKIWLDQGRELGRIYVNIAGPQLHDEGFFGQIVNCLAETEFPANRLGLEVTEGFVMQASEYALATLLKLRDLGIQLAIDDFGTGYSSLSYLKLLPIDKLKIDQSFVRDIPVDPNDMAIAETVIAMGRALKMKVIAEGVETDFQAEFLLSKGCHEAQGYLYSRPLTVNELEDWMSRNEDSK